MKEKNNHVEKQGSRRTRRAAERSEHSTVAVKTASSQLPSLKKKVSATHNPSMGVAPMPKRVL